MLLIMIDIVCLIISDENNVNKNWYLSYKIIFVEKAIKIE